MNGAERNRRLIEEYVAAWAKGDLETGESYYSDDFVAYQAGHGPLAGEYHGRRDLHERWVEPVLRLTCGRWTVEADPEIILSGDEGIVIVVHETMEREGRGRIETKKLVVYTIQDDKITTCRMYDGDQGAIDDFLS
jgi:ketosteroid isomerase-like protein